MTKQELIQQSRERKDAFLAELPNNEGKIRETLRQIDLSPQTYYSWIEKDRTFKDEVKALQTKISEDAKVRVLSLKDSKTDASSDEGAEEDEGTEDLAETSPKWLAEEYSRELCKNLGSRNISINSNKVSFLTDLAGKARVVTDRAFNRAIGPNSNKGDIKLFFDGVKTLNSILNQLGVKVNTKERSCQEGW